MEGLVEQRILPKRYTYLYYARLADTTEKYADGLKFIEMHMN